MNAANMNVGITVAKGAMARWGMPAAAMVTAAMGMVNIMPPSMWRLVSIGRSRIIAMAFVNMSVCGSSSSSSDLIFLFAVLLEICVVLSVVVVVEDLIGGALVVKDSLSDRYGNI